MIHFCRGSMKSDLINLNFFEETFLFKNIESESVSQLLSRLDITVCTFVKGEVIYSPEKFECELGFIVDGECSVCRIRNNGSPLSLNLLHKSDSFGITAVFSDEEAFPTVIYAKKATKVVFISKKSLISLVNDNSKIAMNIISFLTNRIEFLNKKIATLSSCGCDEKLARLLLSESVKHSGEPFVLNCTSAAKGLGIGRASLYRGIKSLSDEGYIEYVDKKIYIKDPKGLKGISK